MPLGRIAGPPVTPLSLTIPARKSATTCFSAAFSASRRSVRASRSPRDSSERGIFSGTDMLGTNRVRYEQGQPRSSSYLPGFLPQVLNGQQAVTAISALWLRRSTAFRWLQQPIGRHLMIDVVEQVIERHQEVKNEGISEALTEKNAPKHLREIVKYMTEIFTRLMIVIAPATMLIGKPIRLYSGFGVVGSRAANRAPSK